MTSLCPSNGFPVVNKVRMRAPPAWPNGIVFYTRRGPSPSKPVPLGPALVNSLPPTPCFSDVWQTTELRERFCGSVAVKGVTGGQLRPKTGKTRSLSGSVARKGLSELCAVYMTKYITHWVTSQGNSIQSGWRPVPRKTRNGRRAAQKRSLHGPAWEVDVESRYAAAAG